MTKNANKKELSNKVKILISVAIILFSNVLLVFGNRFYHLNRKVYVRSYYDVLEYNLDALKEKIEEINKLEEGVYLAEELTDIKIYFNNYYNKFLESKVLEIKKDGYYKNKYMLAIILDTSLLDYSNEVMHAEYMVLDYIEADKDRVHQIILKHDQIQKTLIKYLELAVDNGSSKILSGSNPFRIEKGENIYDYDSYALVYHSELSKCIYIANAVLDKANTNKK